jgi:hypothetical protein
MPRSDDESRNEGASTGRPDAQYSAARLATIRWYINALENEAMQVYFATTDAEVLDEMETRLSGWIDSLRTFAVNVPRPTCPWGAPCWDGTCQPKCPPPPPPMGSRPPAPDQPTH